MDAHSMACFPTEEKRHDDDVCMSDRFIPSRETTRSSTTNMKLSRKENWAPQNEYHHVLSQNILGQESLTDSKVMRYRSSPRWRDPFSSEYKISCVGASDGEIKPRAVASRIVPQNPMKILDAPGIVDDFYSHPIDWSACNIVSVALSEMVFLFNAISGQTSKLLSLPTGNITALRWTGEGIHVSVGTSSGEVQIWDAAAQRQLRSFQGHVGRIGAMAWHNHVLTSGAADAEVHNHDVRIREHLVGRRTGVHSDLVCGLDYNAEGILASGSNDNSVCIWQSPLCTKPLYTLKEHTAAVKALKWCPWQRHVLATGGGTADKQICLWNASSGRLMTSADTGSQVTGIVWGAQERELLTSHGYSRNQLSLWKYPSLTKAADLEGHSGRLLGLAQSPDGSLVCSSSADETLRFWQIFTPNSSQRQTSETFGSNLKMRRPIR